MTGLNIKRGATFRAQMRLRGSDGTAINLSGYTVQAAILHPAGVANVTVGLDDADAGLCTLTLSVAETMAVPATTAARLRVTTTAPDGTVDIASAPLQVVTP